MELNNIIIDILPLSLLILILYKMKPVKPLRALDSTEYLSVDTTKSYRGLFALVVIFHHLSRLTESGVIFHKFKLVGYLAVAYFSSFRATVFKNRISQRGRATQRDFF